MYTVYVLSSPLNRSALEYNLKLKFWEHDISFSGLKTFLGNENFFSMSHFKKNLGPMAFPDWVAVNCVLNYVFDELNLSANIRCERYTVRRGRRWEPRPELKGKKV